MFKDSLGDRMKNYYETASQTHLTRRVPVAIRLDGKAAHTFTRGFNKPFDMVFASAMRDTMQYLCKNIQGCKFGYTQSDEITLILTDYDTIETSAFFDYNVQKLTSVTASMATLVFYRAFTKRVCDYIAESRNDFTLKQESLIAAYTKAVELGLHFDARCFNIPKEEVGNLLYWRQLDAIRNSVQMVGRSYFSNAELNKKSCVEIKEMLKNISHPWEQYRIDLQRGAACYKSSEEGLSGREWILDLEMPVLKDDWNYINKHLEAEKSN